MNINTKARLQCLNILYHYGRDRNAVMAFYLSSVVWFTALRSIAIEIGNTFLDGRGRIFSLGMIVLFSVCAVLPFRNYIKITKLDLAVILFVGFSIVRSLVFHADLLSAYISVFTRFLLQSYLFYLIARNISDWKSVLDAMYIGGTVNILSVAAIFLIRWKCGGQQLFGGEDLYSQFYGILVSKGAVIKIIEFADRRKFRHLPLIGIAVFIIVICGSRTPVVCIVLTLLYLAGSKMQNVLYRRKKKGKWKIALVIVTAAIAVWRLLSYIMHISMNNGIRQGERIIWQIANGKFFSSDGRVAIFYAWKELMQTPLYALFGTGMIGDRVALARQLGVPDSWQGTNAHNYFLELLLQNGIIIGGFLIVLVIVICWNAVFGRYISYGKHMVYAYLISFGIGALMVAETNLSCTELWVLLALGFRDLNIKQLRKG